MCHLMCWCYIDLVAWKLWSQQQQQQQQKPPLAPWLSYNTSWIVLIWSRFKVCILTLWDSDTIKYHLVHYKNNLNHKHFINDLQYGQGHNLKPPMATIMSLSTGKHLNHSMRCCTSWLVRILVHQCILIHMESCPVYLIWTEWSHLKAW